MATNLFCSRCGAEYPVGDQFCKACGANLASGFSASNSASATGASPAAAVASNNPATMTLSNRSDKSAVASFFLCTYLGMLGVHRFYVGKIGTGILMLLTLGGLGIWGLIDLIMIASSKFKDKQGRLIEFISFDPATKSQKSGTVALLLCMFLGMLGIHRFYTGKIGTGILMLITFGGLGIWTLIDLIVITLGNFKDKKGEYLKFGPEAAPSTKGVIMTVIAVILAFAAMVLLIITMALHATSGLTEAARDQLSAIRSHDYARAYSYTSNEFKRATSLEVFEKFVNSYPVLNDNKDSTFSNRQIENGIGIISGSLEAKDGTVMPVTYQLVNENGKWKILNIDIRTGNAGVNESNDDAGN